MRLPLKFIVILWVTLSAKGKVSFDNGIEEISAVFGRKVISVFFVVIFELWPDSESL